VNVCPVLVGRSAELAELRAACDAGGGLVLVSGEAGIGKTRLLREFAEHVRKDRRPVAWARPEAVARSGPYALVADLLDEIAVMLGRSGEEARALAGQLGVSSSSEPAARPIAARVRGMLGALGTGLVLMLEDIHLTDELSQAVIAHLARSARDDDVLIVATYRTEAEGTEGMSRLLDLLTRDRIAVHVRLAPLDREQIAEMVTAMWNEKPSDEELDAMERLGEGIPFFVEELAAARESGGRTIPETIARAVLTRLGQLSEDARTVVRVAALTEGSIDPGVVADAASIEESSVPALLLEAIRAGLLSDQQGRLSFRHALVRAAIADAMVSIEQKDFHRKLATSIEARHATAEEKPYKALAQHWRGAGENVRASECFLESGRQALYSGALDEARYAFKESQRLAPGTPAALDALYGEAGALITMRELDDAILLLRKSAEAYAKAGNREGAAIALRRGAFVLAADATDEAIPVIDEALAILASDSESILYTRLLIFKGYLLSRFAAEIDSGAELLNRGLTRANAQDDTQGMAEAHEGLATVSEMRGNNELATNHGREACRLASSIGDPEIIARTYAHQSARLTLLGRPVEALEHVQEAQVSVSTGLAGFYRHGLENIRAWMLWRLGQPREADRVASALEATKWARDYAGVVRVWAAAEAGDSDRRAALLMSMWEEVGGSSSREAWFKSPDNVPDGSKELFVLIAELLARVFGDDDSPHLTAALAAAVANSSVGQQGDPRIIDLEILARALFRAGDYGAGLEIVSEADALAMAGSYRLHFGAVRELHGMYSLHEGNVATARARFDEGARIFEECGNGSDRARCLRLAAEAAQLRGDDLSEVVERLKTARQLAFEVGALVESNKCEMMLRSLGIRPRAGRPKGSKRAPDTLSAREQEVVALLASGATNPEIAARLFLSERTVQEHISRAQKRLGVVGRAGLAAWAAKHGLV
jgi:DNA-binding CsgD family transcriptional regulator/tetratricopeptide (TPR) repeat protein